MGYDTFMHLDDIVSWTIRDQLLNEFRTALVESGTIDFKKKIF